MKKINSASAVVTTYNNSTTIQKTIESILNQIIPIKDLVIVDDNSSDDTIFKIKCLFKNEIHDGIIKIYINKKNHGGPAFSRNFGISKTTFEYIYLCDGDDIWFPNLTKVYNQIFLKYNPDIISSERIFFQNYTDSKIKIYRKYQFYQLSKFNFLSNPIITSSVAAKKSILQEFIFNQKNNLTGIEDYDCWLRMINNNLKFFKISKELVLYRKTGNSLSSNKFKILIKLYLMFRNNFLRERNYFMKLANIYAFIRLLIFIFDKFINLILRK